MEEVRMEKSIPDRNEHKHRQTSKWVTMLLLNAKQNSQEVRLEREAWDHVLKRGAGTFLAVQWLTLHFSTVGATG